MIKQYVLPVLIGMVLMLVILKLLQKKQPKNDDTIKNDLIAVVKTPEAAKLLTSKEFANVIKTEQFKKFAKDYGTIELASLINI